MYIERRYVHMVSYHGKPLCGTNDGNILWLFPSGETGIISPLDAGYLIGLNLNLVKPDRKYINVITFMGIR